MRKFLVFLLLLGVVVSGCGAKDATLNDEEIIKKEVKVQNITKQSEVNTELTLSGTVVPKQYSLVRSLVPGTIEFLAPVGSQVYVGQPLFSIRDNNIENAYFTASQNLEQTKAVTAQRVQQAGLALNSSKARLDLARSQHSNTVAQTEQALRVVEDSARVTYDSVYNGMNQVLLFLNDGSSLENKKYIYREILTAQSQLRIDTKFKFDQAVTRYLALNYPISSESELTTELENIHQVLLLVKAAVDNTVILLQNALPAGQYEADRLVLINYQTAINQNISAVITGINNITNTKISNRLSIDNAQAQVDLATIEYNNADLSLASAQDGATLEINAAQSQLNSAVYAYSNLTLAAPFSGTIMSHFASAGEQASVGQELIELGDLSLVEMKVDVDVTFAKAIKLNDQVLINDQYQGFVTEVEPVGDLASGKISVTVQSQEAAENLVAGSTAEIKFTLIFPVDETVVVPIKSVNIEANGNYVFLVVDNKVERRDVTLGQIFGDKVTVLSGLNENDHLVLLNGVFISVGDEVNVVE
ncbi:efflux RND transporter periplasmic adaptor subunit [Candidatus Nomurabacteria bacterium]|nr:efflux RND transporter periplasmic adaptor subunit [Candidatus Nomurabacteria bacterium]